MSIHSFIHSFRLFLLLPFKSTTTQRRSRRSTDTVSEFHAAAPQATASEGLAHGPYVSARVGVEPATLRTKGDESTNEPPRPTLPGSIELFLSLGRRFGMIFSRLGARCLESLPIPSYYSLIRRSVLFSRGWVESDPR